MQYIDGHQHFSACSTYMQEFQQWILQGHAGRVVIHEAMRRMLQLKAIDLHASH
jgi:hypothetical protein